MANQPYIKSAVNGLKVYLPVGNVGIMHRFGNNQDNKRLISEVNEQGHKGSETGDLVIPGTAEPTGATL